MTEEEALSYLTAKLGCLVHCMPDGSFTVECSPLLIQYLPPGVPHEVICPNNAALISFAITIHSLTQGAAGRSLPFHPNCRSSLIPSKPQRDAWVPGDWTLKGLINALGGVKQ